MKLLFLTLAMIITGFIVADWKESNKPEKIEVIQFARPPINMGEYDYQYSDDEWMDELFEEFSEEEKEKLRALLD